MLRSAACRTTASGAAAAGDVPRQTRRQASQFAGAPKALPYGAAAASAWLAGMPRVTAAAARAAGMPPGLQGRRAAHGRLLPRSACASAELRERPAAASPAGSVTSCAGHVAMVVLYAPQRAATCHARWRRGGTPATAVLALACARQQSAAPWAGERPHRHRSSSWPARAPNHAAACGDRPCAQAAAGAAHRDRASARRSSSLARARSRSSAERPRPRPSPRLQPPPSCRARGRARPRSGRWPSLVPRQRLRARASGRS